MLLTAMVIGTATAVAGTGRVTLSLVASGTFVWAFVPVLQLLTGLLLVRGTPIGTMRGLEGYFARHHSWSLWLLTVAAAVLLLPHWTYSSLAILASSLVPAYIGARRLAAFCRDDLGFSAATSRRRLLLHQSLTYLFLLLYVDYATELAERVLWSVAR